MATIYSCGRCGLVWSKEPVIREDGSHDDGQGGFCSALPEQFLPRSLTTPSGVQVQRAVALREMALSAHDRLASRVTVAEVQARMLSKASGRQIERILEQQRRAERAEAMFAAATSPQAKAVTLLKSMAKFLPTLERTRCPSCATRHCASCGFRAGHRMSCRLDGFVARILDLIS